MATDRLITAGHVLKAVLELQRRGAQRVLSEWERTEPDLSEYVIESLTALYHKLMGGGVSGAEGRRLYRQAEAIVLVSITALRRAQREAWDEADGGGDDEPLLPSGDASPPTA